MNIITIGTSKIRQLDGLYSLNDLHQAAGGEDRHQPSFFIRLDQTQELIAEICSAEMQIIPTKTVRGRGKQQGTYVCRELVYAYANWISPAFYLRMIRAFDALQVPTPPPAARTALPANHPPRLSSTVRTHINRTAHQLALRQYDTIHGILTDCALSNLACGAKEESLPGYIDALADQSDGSVIVNLRDLRELVWHSEQVINAAAKAIANIYLIEQRSGLKLATRIKRNGWESPNYHKNDFLVQEVLERMTETGIEA